MLSGFRRREELASPAFSPRQTNVEPFSTAEDAAGPCPAPTALGALQTIMGSLCVPPPNAQGFARTQLSTPPINKSQEQQRLLPQGRLSKSPGDAVGTCTSDDVHKSHPRLVELLTCSNDSHESLYNLPMGPLQPSALTSVASSSTGAQPSGSRQYPSDDQILMLIQNKLRTFRAQMKLLKERASTDVDPSNSKSVYAHQGPSCNTPASTGPGKAPENDTVWTIGGKGRSNGFRQEPKRPHLKRSQTAQHSEEYVRIMLETAAICRKEADSPVVLRAQSGSAPEDLFKRNPSHIVHHKPSYQEDESMRRNGNPALDVSKEVHITQKNVTKEAGIVPNVVGTFRLSKRHVTEDQTPHTMEVSEENRPVSSAGRDHLTLHLSPNVAVVELSVPNYHQVMKPEPEQKEIMQERAVQTGAGAVGMELSPSVSEASSILKDPKYDDVTDDEDFDVMPQLVTFDDNDGRLGGPEQSTDVNIYANAPFLQPAITPTHKQEGAERPLSCTCPYFVETDDGFEKMPCPKCAKDTLPIIQEDDSEDESEVILFVTELVLKEEAIVVDSEGEEEEQTVSSPEQHDQHTLFQKIKVYDTFDSFYHSYKQHNKNFPNPLIPLEPAPAEPGPSPRSLLKPSAVEDVASELGLSQPTLQKHLDTVEKAPELAPAPGLWGIFERFPCDPGLSALPDEDSCDTEDSLDYPSHTTGNYLTASSGAQALSPQSCDPDIAEEGEVHRSPEKPSQTEAWFPNLSQDETEEEEESTNNATVLPKTTTRPAAGAEPGVAKTSRKAKCKTRRVIASDSESENDQEISKTFRRSFSSENEVSTLTLKPGVRPRLEREKLIKPVRSKSRAVSIDSTLNQNGSKTYKRTLSIDSDALTQPPKSLKPRTIPQAARPEAHGPVLNVPRSAIKRKSQTDHKRDKRVKRKRPSEVKTPGMGVIVLPGREVTAQPPTQPASNTGRNPTQPASNTSRNPTQPASNTGRNPTQPASNTGRNPTQPSSNTGRNPTQPTACTIQRHSQPAPHLTHRHSSQQTQNYSFLSQVKSTSAKEVLNKKWANDHVPIRKERRSSHEAARTALSKTGSRIDQDVSKPPPKPRSRNNSQDLQTPLMRKTKFEAQQLTKAVHRTRVPSIEQPIREGYKWRGSSPGEDHSEGWLDRMSGDTFQRPHY